MAGIINKVKEAIVGSDHPTDATHGPGHHTTATGTGSSGITGGDSRVDSDYDNSRTTGSSATHTPGLHHNTPGTTFGTTGSTTGSNTTGSGILGGSSTNTSGPHGSNVANKLDPRVDSDNDGSRNTGLTGGTGHHHNTGTGISGTGYSGSSGTGYTGSSGTGYTGSSSTTNTSGPHGSNLANKLDPRVDSDNDGSRTAGNTGSYESGTTGSYGTTGSGITGSSTTGHHHGHHGHSDFASSELRGAADGPHQIGLANALDPNVSSGVTGSHHTGAQPLHDSNLIGSTGLTGTHHTTGTHNTTGTESSGTSGPHSSSLLNKLDPRVDSDRDGSKTH